MGESPIGDVDVKPHRQTMGMEPVLGPASGRPEGRPLPEPEGRPLL